MEIDAEINRVMDDLKRPSNARHIPALTKHLAKLRRERTRIRAAQVKAGKVFEAEFGLKPKPRPFPWMEEMSPDTWIGPGRVRHEQNCEEGQ